MKNIVLFLFSTFIFVSCNAQTKEDTEKKQSKISKEENKPKIDYKVNKHYDENGNLIRLDSTYTYYYSNIDKNAMINDSIFRKFNEHFKTKSPFNNSLFDDFFKQDSYLENDFFTQDFFRENFNNNQEIMDKMLSRMDSLKNYFLMDQFPIKEEIKRNK